MSYEPVTVVGIIAQIFLAPDITKEFITMITYSSSIINEVLRRLSNSSTFTSNISNIVSQIVKILDDVINMMASVP